jgi:hypothetical protein
MKGRIAADASLRIAWEVLARQIDVPARTFTDAKGPLPTHFLLAVGLLV